MCNWLWRIGGYTIEMLGRLGIGHIIAVDHDVFQESNLNRQILSDNEVIGTEKAIIAKIRMKKVNSLVSVDAITEKVTVSNCADIIKSCNVVVDALDNIETRLMLERICFQENKPLVSGAIGGWYGQVTTILPGDNTLKCFFKGKASVGVEKELGNPSFTPAIIASIQVSEVVKLLIQRGEILRKKILIIDLLNHDYEIIRLGT